MNERIRELAELCYEVKPLMVENSQKIGNDGVPLYNEVFNQEKFAELIVKECCDWIEGSPANDAGQLHLTKSFIIANLKGMFRESE
jgi:hypothetical protein